MPSVTYWSRVEPRPRGRSVNETLAARVRDPLWFLTRQWQVGEFQGEDNGSPAYARVATRTARLSGWRAAGGDEQPLGPAALLERESQREPRSPTLGLRVELGQTFEDLLAGAVADPHSLIAAFRSAYPIDSPAPGRVRQDRDGAMAQQVLSGRAIDGIALFEAADSALPGLPAAPAIPAGQQPGVLSALGEFRDWVLAVFGRPGTDDPLAWRPERLEYSLEVLGTDPAGAPLVLAAEPSRHGTFEWYSFSQERPTSAGSGEHAAGEENTSTLIPARIAFRGMADKRWWVFESNVLDFGSVRADRRDLAKMLVLDFMLVHGNDWFAIPLEQPVGTVRSIERLVVKDVFGVDTPIGSGHAGGERGRWSMFTITAPHTAEGVADYFVLPPTAGPHRQIGTPVEEVRWFRDEMANLVWAIEHTVEDWLGAGRSAHERGVLGRAPAPAPAGAGLRYRIQTDVPENWFPFPAVALDPVRGEVALERAALLRTESSPPEPIEPVGRVLRPTSPPPYRVREEEVERTGATLQRVPCLARSIDGTTHMWLSRVRSAGRGEGASGLKFDTASDARK